MDVKSDLNHAHFAGIEQWSLTAFLRTVLRTDS